MKRSALTFLVSLLVLPAVVGQTVQNGWITVPRNGYVLHYTPFDASRIQQYGSLIDSGIRDVVGFFHTPYERPFDVFVHPTRHSLDSTWSIDWKTPGFKSECWMVASGVAARLDLLSPATWDTASCEHSSRAEVETQRIVTHELVHVYHGQHNPSPDFSEVTGLDWFVEGLATYASGQCDSVKMDQVRNALVSKELPQSLEKFWTGKWRYGLSGSTVMFIDRKYGRTTLIGLLKCTKLPDLLGSLRLSEKEFTESWKSFVLDSRR